MKQKHKPMRHNEGHSKSKIQIWRNVSTHNQNYKRKCHCIKWLHEKKERSHITNITTYLKTLEKQEVMSKKYRPEEIIKLRNEIKKVETQKSNESIK